jgi:hypothetical protein
MTKQPALKLFISYSHADKRVAHRVVRRLTAYGANVWIDESGLRIGATLNSSLRAHIRSTDIVLVIASKASAVSDWVGLELDFAIKMGKPVVPLFIESVDTHGRFRDHLGIDAKSPQAFAYAVEGMIRDLFLSFDLEQPQADPAVLEAGLRELAREEPDLNPLIIGCLSYQDKPWESNETQELPWGYYETVYNSIFHPLDYTLNTLYDLMPNETMARNVSNGFSIAGAGTMALYSWIAKTGNGGTPLVFALGRTLAPSLIKTAIKLLESCNPPNNHALYSFINENATQLDITQRRSVIRLVTWPVRDDPKDHADTLGYIALKHFPDAVAIQEMWCRWIHSGVFDCIPRYHGEFESKFRALGHWERISNWVEQKPFYTSDLVYNLELAHKERLPGWESVNEALRRHVRGYLRSGDESKVYVAVAYVRSCANANIPVARLLLREMEGVGATAEWERWAKKNPDTAKRMKYYVFYFAKEATGERNWIRALENVERIVTDDKEFNGGG